MQIEPIAYFRSPFATKFGVPKQSGLVENLMGTIEFVPQHRNADALRGMEEFDISGLYGNSQPTVTPPPVPLCVRRCLAATAKWECSPRVRRFDLTVSDSPRCAYRR